MSHATVELHETHPYEQIADWEHDVVHEEFAKAALYRVAATNRVDEHLPRGCYFSVTATFVDVKAAWDRIEFRLQRRVSVEFTIGSSYGFGLDPVVHSIAPKADVLSPIYGPPVVRLWGK